MSSLRITLRAGERIFVNGAVLKVERKTTLEFLNDVSFLLESHVMQAEDATTPLRQLYFIVQMMLIEPGTRQSASTLFCTSHAAMMKAYGDRSILDGLRETDRLVEKDRPFEALKVLRGLIAADEAQTLSPAADEAVPEPVNDSYEPLRAAAGGR